MSTNIKKLYLNITLNTDFKGFEYLWYFSTKKKSIQIHYSTSYYSNTSEG